MRFLLLAGIGLLLLNSCNKDKYTTAPQIEYKSVSPNYSDNSTTSVLPVITFSVTDAEGDLGINNKDTARIFLKNLLTNDFDSLDFPDISGIDEKDFKADIRASVNKVIGCASSAPVTDTIFYEVFIRDFAGNKSNTIVTGDPTFFKCP